MEWDTEQRLARVSAAADRGSPKASRGAPDRPDGISQRKHGTDHKVQAINEWKPKTVPADAVTAHTHQPTRCRPMSANQGGPVHEGGGRRVLLIAEGNQADAASL